MPDLPLIQNIVVNNGAILWRLDGKSPRSRKTGMVALEGDSISLDVPVPSRSVKVRSAIPGKSATVFFTFVGPDTQVIENTTPVARKLGRPVTRQEEPEQEGQVDYPNG